MKNIAILIIHGLASNPDIHLEVAINLSSDFDVYSFVLPGHDKKLFSSPTKEDWINSSRKNIDNLIKIGYKEIYLIGHSMGGVIATYLASEYKCVTKLVLEAPAFSYNKKQKIKLLKYYNMKFLFNAVTRLTLNTYKEFKNLVDEYKNYINKIDIPTLIIQGDNDILVPVKSSINAYNKIKCENKYLYIIKGMPHAIPKSVYKNEVNLIIKHFFNDNVFNYNKYKRILNNKYNEMAIDKNVVNNT